MYKVSFSHTHDDEVDGSSEVAGHHRLSNTL